MADNKPQTMTQQTVPTVRNNDEVEIDLLQLFFELRKHFLKILLAAIIGGGIAGAFSKFVITPQFRSTAMMYILSKETTLTSLADLQIGSQLTNDYKTIVTSRPVLQSVVDELGLDMTYRTLGNKVSVNNPANTRIITITAEDPDPQRAKQIADAVANTSSDFIGDIMEMVPPKMIESGEVATQKSSPSNGRNAAIGAMIGALLVCGWVVVNMLMNDTIVTTDDVTNYLGVSVLASVPTRAETSEEEKNEKNFGQSRKKRRKRGLPFSQ